MASKEKGIFLFFGEDITTPNTGLLSAHYSARETLLPVDAMAMQKVRQEGLSFTLLEDWIGPETTLMTRWAADDWETRWFVPSRDAFSSDGICWPVFDREALNWYWRDLTLADTMVKACQERGVRRISLFLNTPPRPAFYYYRSDIHGHLLRAALGERVSVYETSHNPWPTLLMPAISLDRLSNGSEVVAPNRISGRIALVLNPGEIHRFTPVIQQLAEHYGDRVMVITLWPSPMESNKLSHRASVEVLTPRIASKLDTGLAKRFLSGYHQVVTAAKSEGEAWAEPLSLNRFQFEYYCGLRLPVLATNYRAWLTLWQTHAPAMVITSSLPDGESQLPALAADHAGIPTVSLPHGGFTTREENCYARTVLYNCEPARKVYAAAGIEANRLRPCKEIISENEYPFASEAALIPRKGWRILVLTNPVKFDTCLFNTTMIGSQLAALKDIANPPAYLLGKIDLTIKTHPNRHDQALIELTGADLAGCVLPLTVPLAEALKQADLVVALNYPGTALIYTLQARKPVIFYWNDPLLLQRSHTYRHSHLMLPAGERVESGEELWCKIESFFTDPTFAAALKRQADDFARNHLDSSTYPSLSDIIEDKMSPSEEGLADVHRRPVTQLVETIFPGVANIAIDYTDYEPEPGAMTSQETQLLCAAIRSRQPKTIFEIGTSNGAMTLHMATNSNARIYTLDRPPKMGRTHRSTPNSKHSYGPSEYPDIPGSRFHGSPHVKRIVQILADSQSFDYSPYFGKIDFVIVDNCYDHDFLIRDSMNAFKMLSPDGAIVWPNYDAHTPVVMRALETVCRRFPIVHIAETSIAVYLDTQPL